MSRLRVPLPTVLLPLLLLTTAVGCAANTRTNAEPSGVKSGAAPVGRSMYSMPSGSKFVSPSGNDAGSGSEASPWRTVAHAVSRAPSGGTIVLRGGSYRETVTIPATKRVTIQPFPGEAPWFTGSVRVTSWQADGGDWRSDQWVANLDRNAVNPDLIDPAHPTAGRPDMTFLDGAPLRQVASRAAVVPGTFFVDVAGKRLWIGSNPGGHLVEGTVRAEALNVMSNGTVIRGIGFKHYGTNINRNAAVKISGAGVVIEHSHFQRNAAAGLSIRASNVTARMITASGNGQLGVHGHQAHNLVVEDSRVSGNNSERFEPTSAGGGLKLTGSTGTRLRRNVMEDNYGHGLWLDEHCDGAAITHNVTRRNARGSGIMFEYSNGGGIAGNVSADNEGGIEAGESSNVDIWNNTLVNNTFAISAYDGHRAPVPQRITIRNNVLSSSDGSERPMLMNEDFTGRRNWAQMGVSSNHNAYYRRSSTSTRYVAALANGPAGKILFERVGEIRVWTNQETHSLTVDNAQTDPFVVNAGAGDYRLPPDSGAQNRGTALPQNIAMFLGVQPGVSVDIGVI